MITVENKVITIKVQPASCTVEVDPTVISVEVVKGKDGQGVPQGGSAGQVLRKRSASNYDTEWSSAGTATWGAITGTLSQQEDLYEELDARPTASDLGALALQDTADLSSDVTGVLPAANGGTGAATAAGARENLGLGDLAVKDAADLSSDVTGTLLLRSGGTGAVTAAGARENLGLGDLAVKDTADLSSDVTGTLPLSSGGTGAATASGARENLGLGDLAVKDTADLSSDVTGTLLLRSGGTGATTAAGARENLGLGAMATAADAPADNSEYVRKNNAWAEASASSGAAWGAITGTLSDQTDLYTSLSAKANSADLGALAAKDSADLSSDVTGTLPIANGGTGAITAAGALASLGAMAADTDHIALKGAAMPYLDFKYNGSTNWTSRLIEAQAGLLYIYAENGLYYEGDPVLTGDSSGLLPLTKGGTGAGTAAGARENLGLGDLAVKDTASLTSDVTGVLPMGNGGTGSSTAPDPGTYCLKRALNASGVIASSWQSMKNRARTITVGPSGKNFTDIQAAIDSIIPGEIVTIEVYGNDLDDSPYSGFTVKNINVTITFKAAVYIVEDDYDTACIRFENSISTVNYTAGDLYLYHIGTGTKNTYKNVPLYLQNSRVYFGGKVNGTASSTNLYLISTGNGSTDPEVTRVQQGSGCVLSDSYMMLYYGNILCENTQSCFWEDGSILMTCGRTENTDTVKIYGSDANCAYGLYQRSSMAFVQNAPTGFASAPRRAYDGTPSLYKVFNVAAVWS